MKKIKFLSTALILFALTACGGGASKESVEPGGSTQPSAETSEQPGETSTPSEESSAEESIIKEVKANSENVTIKLDDVVAATSFYTITGYKTLTGKQKKVTIESANPAVVEVSGANLVGKSLGTTTVTITSVTDTTKSCSFSVLVKDVYFDRTISSSFTADDDFEKELIEDGGIVRTGSSSTLDLFIKAEATTAAYVEGKFVWNSTNESEAFPKFGVVFSSLSYPVRDYQIEGISDNRVVIFFNPEDCHNQVEFTKFGVCEIKNSGQWAWNAGVTNETARHKDDAFVSETPIAKGGEFTMGVARKGSDFHVWINGAYRFSFTTLEHLFHTDEGTDALTNFGFFEFNSDVTISNYSFTEDVTEIDNKIGAVTEKKFIGDSGFEWAAD